MNFNFFFGRKFFLKINVGFFLFLLLFAVTSAAEKEIEIISFYAKVYVAPSTNANFIGLSQKGERYPVLGVRGNWYHIRFKNANGWIEASQVRVIDPYAEATEERDRAVAQVEANTTAKHETEQSETSLQVEDKRAAKTGFQVTPVDTQRISAAYQQAPSVGTPPTAFQNRTVPQRRPTAPQEPRSVEKKESKLRSWFTQQNLPQLPPTLIPQDSQTVSMRYFHVQYPSPVREFLNPEAPILGMAKRGEMLLLISEGDAWCRVAFADTVGWIEKRHGRIIDPDITFVLDYVKIGLIAGGIVVISIAIGLFIFIILRIRKKKTPTEVSSVSTRHVVIVAESTKIIQYTLTNGTTTLEKCFREVGFSTTFLRDLPSLKMYLQRQITPEVILVDYHIEKNILSSLESICVPLGFASSILFIIYNVPDTSAMNPPPAMPKTAFLGITFSDRDLFKLVTPMIRPTDGDSIQKSVQSSALAGDIAAGNLLEVLQFIEIGSKTGCLLVETSHPFAIICFKNGRIIFAATADKIIGREAIFKVLDLKIGKFRFVLDKKPKESNVNLSTLEVLMEWAKTVDEAHRH